jgi:hypothetical protein
VTQQSAGSAAVVMIAPESFNKTHLVGVVCGVKEGFATCTGRVEGGANRVAVGFEIQSDLTIRPVCNGKFAQNIFCIS